MGERLTVGEICTRSVTIAFRSTPLNGAARLMRENHVGSLVVVEETGGLRVVVGILTDRDIVMAVVAKDADAKTLRTGDVMTATLASVRESDTLYDVLSTMRSRGVRRVPVTGPHGTLAGILTLDDVLNALAGQLQALGSVVGRERRQEFIVRP